MAYGLVALHLRTSEIRFDRVRKKIGWVCFGVKSTQGFIRRFTHDVVHLLSDHGHENDP